MPRCRPRGAADGKGGNVPGGRREGGRCWQWRLARLCGEPMKALPLFPAVGHRQDAVPVRCPLPASLRIAMDCDAWRNRHGTFPIRACALLC